MNKQELIEILQKLLQTDTNLDFLNQLADQHLETLVASVRSRLDQDQ
jgi:hypothetical protein